MKNITKIFMIICMSCLFLSGCANVNYTVLYGESEIVQILTVELDSNKLEEVSLLPSQAKSIITSELIAFSNLYNEVYLTNVNTLISNKDISAALGQSLLDCVKTTGPIWNGNTLTYQTEFTSAYEGTKSINFLNIYYLYYYGYLDPEFEESEPVIEEKGFIKKASSTDKTIFAGEIAKLYRRNIIDAFKEEGFTFTDDSVSYTYTYGTPYHRLHSNADLIERSNQYYLHTWELDNSESEVTLYRNYANQYLWYVVALAFSGAVLIVLLLHAKNKKNNHTAEVEIIPPQD